MQIQSSTSTPYTAETKQPAAAESETTDKAEDNAPQKKKVSVGPGGFIRPLSMDDTSHIDMDKRREAFHSMAGKYDMTNISAKEVDAFAAEMKENRDLLTSRELMSVVLMEATHGHEFRKNLTPANGPQRGPDEKFDLRAEIEGRAAENPVVDGSPSPSKILLDMLIEMDATQKEQQEDKADNSGTVPVDSETKAAMLSTQEV